MLPSFLEAIALPASRFNNTRGCLNSKCRAKSKIEIKQQVGFR